jgi:kumamolisin
MNTDFWYFYLLANRGVAVFASSGDGGSSPGPGGHDHTGPVQVEFPANEPTVVAVGGTSLFLNPATGWVTNETAWYGGGGGVSRVFGRAGWQVGPGVPNGTTRCVPDVALAADPNTGAYVILKSQLWQFGGTSWSAPTWSGICARINQARAYFGKAPLGFLASRLYRLIGTVSFRDITSGSNGPNGVYNAGPGYDLCTGIGVPNVWYLIPTLTAQP